MDTAGETLEMSPGPRLVPCDSCHPHAANAAPIRLVRDLSFCILILSIG